MRGAGNVLVDLPFYRYCALLWNRSYIMFNYMATYTYLKTSAWNKDGRHKRSSKKSCIISIVNLSLHTLKFLYDKSSLPKECSLESSFDLD